MIVLTFILVLIQQMIILCQGYNNARNISYLRMFGDTFITHARLKNWHKVI